MKNDLSFKIIQENIFDIFVMRFEYPLKNNFLTPHQVFAGHSKNLTKII